MNFFFGFKIFEETMCDTIDFFCELTENFIKLSELETCQKMALDSIATYTDSNRFQEVFNRTVRLMGVVTLNEHISYVKKFDSLQKKKKLKKNISGKKKEDKQNKDIKDQNN
jgi:hypothetical protein